MTKMSQLIKTSHVQPIKTHQGHHMSRKTWRVFRNTNQEFHNSFIAESVYANVRERNALPMISQ